jgi:hypothetical protein
MLLLKLVLLLPVTTATITARWAASPLSTTNVYPVFWNVDESEQSGANVTQFGILASKFTQTGDSSSFGNADCNSTHCGGWLGGRWPYIAGEGDRHHPAGYPVYGGVPQATNLSAHLETVRAQLPQYIPDPAWPGNAVFDFEAWSTVWELNTWNSSGSGWHDHRYQNLSIALVWEAHPTWDQARVVRQAKAQFESAATEFFVKTLETCRAMRPRARWGFYGLPLGRVDPGDASATSMAEQRVRQLPIYRASTAIFPSVYLPPYQSPTCPQCPVDPAGQQAIVAKGAVSPGC